MRFVQIIFLAVVLVATLAVTVEDKKDQEVCTCGVFGQKGKDKISGQPLLTKDVDFVSTCDENGAKDCDFQCEGFGIQNFAHNNQDLCHKIRDTPKPLRPSIYWKLCNEKMWTYVGMTFPRDYCCLEGKHDICDGLFD